MFGFGLQGLGVRCLGFKRLGRNASSTQDIVAALLGVWDYGSRAQGFGVWGFGEFSVQGRRFRGFPGCTLKGIGQALTPMTPRAERLKMVVVISRTRLHSSNFKV